MPNSASLVFDGVNDYADAPHAAVLDLTGTDFTVELWWKSTEPNHNHGQEIMLAKTENDFDSAQPYRIRIDFNNLYAGYRSGGTWYELSYNLAANGVAVNTWHHTALTYVSATRALSLYLNATLVVGPSVQGAAQVAAGAGASSRLVVGKVQVPGNGWWLGGLDEIRLWSVARSGAEVTAYKDVQAAGTETGLVACYRANEAAGTTVADLAGTAQDLTLSGATWSAVDYPALTDAGGGAQDTPELRGRPFGRRGQTHMHQLLAQ